MTMTMTTDSESQNALLSDRMTLVKEQASRIFTSLDTNSNGYLDEQELTRYVRWFSREVEDGDIPIRVRKLFQEFDGNGDGRISLHEWVAGITAGLDDSVAACTIPDFQKQLQDLTNFADELDRGASEFYKERRKQVRGMPQGSALVQRPPPPGTRPQSSPESVAAISLMMACTSMYAAGPIGLLVLAWRFSRARLRVKGTRPHPSGLEKAALVLLLMLTVTPLRLRCWRWPFTLPLWRVCTDYFSFRLIEQCPDLPRHRRYLFANAPHGVINVGLALHMQALMLRGQSVQCLAASVLFRLPVLRQLLSWAGAVPATQEQAALLLRRPYPSNITFVTPGGIAEMFLGDETTERLFLGCRKGFVKQAICAGCDLVPVYYLGKCLVCCVFLCNWVLVYCPEGCARTDRHFLLCSAVGCQSTALECLLENFHSNPTRDPQGTQKGVHHSTVPRSMLQVVSVSPVHPGDQRAPFAARGPLAGLVVCQLDGLRPVDRGNNQLFRRHCAGQQSLLCRLSRRLQASLILFHGRFGCPLIPYRHPVVALVGNPIQVTQADEPTEAHVEQTHARFMAALKNLFDEYKGELGWEDRILQWEDADVQQ